MIIAGAEAEATGEDPADAIVPIIVDETRRVLAGHARLESAKRLGFTHVPVVRVEHLSEDEKRAFVIADNRIAEKAGWDLDGL